MGGSFVQKNARAAPRSTRKTHRNHPHAVDAFLVETRLFRQPTTERGRVAICSQAALVTVVWVRQEGSCVVRSRCVSPKMQKKKEHYVCE